MKKYFNVEISFNSFKTKKRNRKSIINLKKNNDNAAEVKKNGSKRIARCAIHPFPMIKKPRKGAFKPPTARRFFCRYKLLKSGQGSVVTKPFLSRG